MPKTFVRIATIVPTILLSACSFSEPLSCSSDHVKSATIELMMDQVRDKEANIYLVQTPGAGSSLMHNEVALKKMLVTGDIGYQEIVNANNGPKVQAIIDAIDNRMEAYQLDLENIRTTATDEALDSVSCEAEVVVSNPEHDVTVSISYQAQTTDDDGIYISMNHLF